MPKNEENAAILKDRQGRDVVLTGVEVRARLHGLMAEIEVEQSYTNSQQTNIEAVYTFPLPIGAVLLGLEVEIAGKTLSGSVVERKQAERNYEDAITDGNSAVMLENAGPGLYTASIGNLMANESAMIRYRYSLLLSWQGPRLRFLLPTTIAPRYGDAKAAGIRPHQVPSTALDVEYPLDISVSVEGALAAATITSPSHPIAVERAENGVTLRLSGKAVLDRDFILTLVSDTAQSSCVQTPDRQGVVALASLRIPQVQHAQDQALALKVLIDCSGSMAGTSITQARKAALEILNQLRPQDSFNVTLFGSQHQHFFRTLVPASAKYITEAWNQLDNLDADMGGTEMEAAIDAAFSIGGPEGCATLLLITDGEIHEHEKLVKRAHESGHRVFVVGVGSAVAETFLQSLAKATDGACELVAPQEGMAERVLSQFHRMRQPRLGDLRIEWPANPQWQTPLPETVFAGDTVHVFAGFSKAMTGSVKLVIEGSGEVAATIILANEIEIPRIAAARRMESAPDDEGLRLALDYQLLSRWTNYLVIAEQADKAEDLPELHQVPQMLAAGWGGSSSVVMFSRRSMSVDESSRGMDKYDIPTFLRRSVDIYASDAFDVDASATPSMFESTRANIRRLEAKLFGRLRRRQSPSENIGTADRSTIASPPAKFIATLEAAMAPSPHQPQLPRTIGELEQCALDSEITRSLRELVAQGHEEAEVVAAFIYALTQSDVGECFGRAFKRAILKAWKQVVPDRDIDQQMAEMVKSISPDAWHWQHPSVKPDEMPRLAG